MKSITVIVAAQVFAIFALAQDITSLPECAQQPILLAISKSGCPLTDIHCICDNDAFIAGLLQEIPILCTPSEVQITSEFAEALCGASGVTLDLPDAAFSTAAPSSATTSDVPATTRASATAPGSTSGSGTVTSPGAAASTSGAAGFSPTVSAASSVSPTTSASTTPNGAAVNVVGFGAVAGAVVVGFVAPF